jgi:hypothetical protein
MDPQVDLPVGVERGGQPVKLVKPGWQRFSFADLFIILDISNKDNTYWVVRPVRDNFTLSLHHGTPESTTTPSHLKVSRQERRRLSSRL